ncbi:MAG: hypothetical protein ACREDL_23715 [Bradyrhizobium sp.]
MIGVARWRSKAGGGSKKKILWGQKKSREKTAAKPRKQDETRITRFRG